ncbi:MAG: NAD(P)-dependent alcohol dehydrogenase [Alcanivoracaceae bacterium]|nr:NAD(P)-dependent alcohol dehydrogenase [Alcanivoracaceae bacterium]
MKAIITKKYGNESVLQLLDIPKPKISANEILVKIKACSVNPVDWKIRSGKIIIKTGPKPPKVLGSDFAGVIDKVGKNIKAFKMDESVWGKVDSFKGGAYATFIKVKPENITIIPKDISYTQAASIPNVGLTAYQSLINQAHLKKGQRVLINGASGGVGIMAVQIAKSYGCHVTAVCSSKNSGLVKKLGADVTIDYTCEDVLQGNDCYHVFFDCVANQSLLKVNKTLKKGGTYVRTTPSFESIFLFPILKILLNKSSKHIMVKPDHENLLALKRMIETIKLIPVIEKTFSFDNVSQAHILSESGHVVGKIVLEP